MGSQTIDAAASQCLELLKRAFPVTSADSLLECLVAIWSECLNTPVLFASFVARSHLYGLMLENGRVEPRTIPFESEWTTAAAADLMSGFPGECPELFNSMTVIPLESEYGMAGGVVLPGVAVNDTLIKPLADVSARLIEQLRQSSAETIRHKKHASPADDDALRDLKLEAMAEFAAGAGHEINNPVATIAGRTALLLRAETNPERRRALETIGGQAYRIRDMIGDAMTIARPPAPILENLATTAAMNQVLDSFDERFSAASVTTHCDLDDSIVLQADPEQFRVVISCLLLNALEASSDGDAVTMRLSTISLPAGMAELAVTDQGPGLTDNEREHLFDPFFSGRQAGRGLGFGLSKCWRIVQMHGGEIHAEPNQERGLTVRVLWPVAD